MPFRAMQQGSCGISLNPWPCRGFFSFCCHKIGGGFICPLSCLLVTKVCTYVTNLSYIHRYRTHCLKVPAFVSLMTVPPRPRRNLRFIWKLRTSRFSALFVWNTTVLE